MSFDVVGCHFYSCSSRGVHRFVHSPLPVHGPLPDVVWGSGRRPRTVPSTRPGRCGADPPHAPYGEAMRWEAFFDDLEGQAQARERAAWEAEVGDRVRAERLAVPLADRVRAARRPLGVRLLDGTATGGTVTDVGRDWFLLDPGAAGVLVPMASVAGLTGLSHDVDPGDGVVGRRLGLASVLRGLAQRRVEVSLALAGGPPLHGTLDAVFADHVDLACHPAGEPRRRDAVRGTWSVRFAALMHLRTR